MLRILLLSDIHLLSIAKENDPDFELRKSFLCDINDYFKSKGAINHIFICGDIAFKGSEDEYKEASSFIDFICKQSGCPKDEVYVVPGNHDKNYNAPNSQMRNLINAGLGNESSSSDIMFNELLTNDFNCVKTLFEPFKEYYKFAFKLDSSEPLMNKILDEESTNKYISSTDKAFMVKHINDLAGYKILLYGMNTALNSDQYDINDQDKGHKLFLSRLSYNANTENEGCINIAMMHHPLDRIVNGKDIAKITDEKFHIQIFGHLHRPASDKNNSIHILSGAFQPPKSGVEDLNYFSIFNILELDVIKNNGKDNLNINLLVEKYNSKKKEFVKINEESKTFSIELKKEHKSRWDTEVQSQTEEIRQGLPPDISIKKVRFTFLQKTNPNTYIKRLSTYDDKKSENENYVSFLKNMESENRLGELWNIMKE